MARRAKITVRLVCLTVLVAVLVWLARSLRSVDPEVLERRRQIAEACLTLLRSSLTNEMDIAVDDPRIPEAIRTMNPSYIELGGSDAVVFLPGSPSEYHLSRDPDDSGVWILYAAGEEGGNQHRELIRIRGD